MPSRSRQLVAILSLALAAAVAACSAPPPPPRDPGALAIVVGGRNNMPLPTLPDDLTKSGSIVETAIRSEDTLYVVAVSGEPRQVYSKSMASECDGPNTCKSVVEDFLADIDKQIASVKATAPEADTLGAIAVAARAIAASPGPRQIIVIDNGLQTTGEFQLQDSRVLFTDEEIDLDKLADRLRTEHRLERALAGVDIFWVGIASSSPPQAIADQRPLENLRKLWEKIFHAAGAKVTFVGGLADGGPPAHPNLPPVTPVNVKDEPIDPTDPWRLMQNPAIDPASSHLARFFEFPDTPRQMRINDFSS